MRSVFTIFLSFIILALPSGAANDSGDGSRTDRWAVVSLSSIYMRTLPDYESALETQELMGSVVRIVGEKGYWREIVSEQPYRAWCTEKGLIEMSEKQIETYRSADKCIFTDLYGHVYERPSDKSATVCDLVGGDILRFMGKRGRWVRVMLPSGTEGWIKAAQTRLHEGFRSIAKGEGDSGTVSEQEMECILDEAMKLKGVPYLWGGMTSKGVDCSGLVRISYLMNGILLPRNASQQIFCGDEVEMTPDTAFWQEERRVMKEGRYSEEFIEEMNKRIRNLERGDLVFFGTPSEDGSRPRITHVGIYIGEGHIIHSSHLVRINSLIPTDDDYYENAHRLLAARRL